MSSICFGALLTFAPASYGLTRRLRPRPNHKGMRQRCDAACRLVGVGSSRHSRSFTPVLGDKQNCVNFPLLEAVLASLWQQRRQDFVAMATAVLSLAIASAH